jgi:hypothetical protein
LKEGMGSGPGPPPGVCWIPKQRGTGVHGAKWNPLVARQGSSAVSLYWGEEVEHWKLQKRAPSDTNSSRSEKHGDQHCERGGLSFTHLHLCLTSAHWIGISNKPLLCLIEERPASSNEGSIS